MKQPYRFAWTALLALSVATPAFAAQLNAAKCQLSEKGGSSQELKFGPNEVEPGKNREAKLTDGRTVIVHAARVPGGVMMQYTLRAKELGKPWLMTIDGYLADAAFSPTQTLDVSESLGFSLVCHGETQ